PSVGRDLAGFAAKRWVEHIVIGSPFGILGMDAAGHVGWLQLETPEGLKAMAELAEIEGVPPSGLQEIRQGLKLADLELRQGLGRSWLPLFQWARMALCWAPCLRSIRHYVPTPATATATGWHGRKSGTCKASVDAAGRDGLRDFAVQRPRRACQPTPVSSYAPDHWHAAIVAPKLGGATVM